MLAYTSNKFPTVVTIQSLLASVHAQSITYLRGLNDDDLSRSMATAWGATYALVEMIGHLLEHEIYHRAELSLILGMLGREGLNA